MKWHAPLPADPRRPLCGQESFGGPTHRVSKTLPVTCAKCINFGAPIRTLRDLGFAFDDLEGGIIGSVEIIDCVTDSASPWFVGRYGFVLRDPQPLPFTPWRGQLGFFEVPDSEVPR